LFTSGTTGKPKKISHNLKSITRNVKTGPNYAANIWAYAYNPTHIAGLQVFFQGLFNYNSMIYTFETQPKLIPLKLQEYNITNISATPSYYRLFFPFLTKINLTLTRITSGGEKFDDNIINKISHYFPNAIIRNIYATTEAGSLLNSDGEYFLINDGNESLFRVNDRSELLIHESLLGTSEDIILQNGWYNSGDIVEFIDKNKLRIIGRSDNLINIGGYKINSDEICDIIKEFSYINDVLVYSQSNSVLGKVLVADIILNSNIDCEVVQQLKKELNLKLPKWKIPVKFNIVNQFQLTRTGKKLIK
jgi:acyl-coenzyme A synthetase/AMP-(fatty) acid ligase